jgi:hypothetical protein
VHKGEVRDTTGHSSLIASQRRYFFTIPLAFLTFPLASQAEPKITPAAEIDLHTHAEWRVNAQIEFDSAGRLLILYREKFRLNPTGNWHLIRLAGPFSGELRREEIAFSIPQEPVDPESRRRWDSFSSRLVLSPDGSHALAVFEGAVVTAKSGPPPAGATRNVSGETFSSRISFDLTAFRVLASADVSQHPDNLADEQISTKGESMVQLAESTCKMRPGASAFGIGKDETVKNYIIEADRLCTRDESGKEELVSADLLPRCRQGWDVSAISPDRHSALTSCILMDTFLDTFFYISRASLQLIDVRTLAVKTTIPLSTRHRSALAVFHHSGTSTIAVVEDGARLLVYAVAD